MKRAPVARTPAQKYDEPGCPGYFRVSFIFFKMRGIL